MNKPIISIDDIKQALEFRYATKAFDSSKKISQENIELLLEAARLAPSSYGFEAVEYYRRTGRRTATRRCQTLRRRQRCSF